MAEVGDSTRTQVGEAGVESKHLHPIDPSRESEAQAAVPNRNTGGEIGGKPISGIAS